MHSSAAEARNSKPVIAKTLLLSTLSLSTVLAAMSVYYHRLRQEEQEANPQAAAAAAAPAAADTAAAGATAAAAVAAPKKLRGDKLKKADRRAQPGRPRVVVLSPTGELAQQVTHHLLLCSLKSL
jgi:superfamily II DNA/RNA helicase